mmetsp:Transcript_87719/g.272634  ORF Transcript_87719/g.272634 Transcript_87719/m.272634 type:complete len:201 (-) Transcript_87719:486-1088(-)
MRASLLTEVREPRPSGTCTPKRLGALLAFSMAPTSSMRSDGTSTPSISSSEKNRWCNTNTRYMEYATPALPVVPAGKRKAYSPKECSKYAPTRAPRRKAGPSVRSTESLLKSSAASTMSTASKALPQRFLISMESSLPRSRPTSVTRPVTCVVLMTAPPQIVAIPFCRPHAEAARYLAQVWSASKTVATKREATPSKQKS